MTGTLQGQVQIFHLDVGFGTLKFLVTIRYFYGTIWQILPTLRHEFAMLTDSGLYFVEAFQDKNTQQWCVPTVSDSEVYLQNQRYTLIVEYERDKFLVASKQRPHFVKIDRTSNIVARYSQYVIIEDPSLPIEGQIKQKQGYSDLQLMKGFDPDEFPYCIAMS